MPLPAMSGAEPCTGSNNDGNVRSGLMLPEGAMLIVPVYLMLGYTEIPPVIPMAMMGVAFALVPSVMWPALVYVVDKSRLGMANIVLCSTRRRSNWRSVSVVAGARRGHSGKSSAGIVASG